MHASFDWLWNLSPVQAVFWLTVANIAVFAMSLIGGYLLVILFAKQPVGDAPDPLSWQEVALAAGCVVLNSGVAIAGWWLWKAGYIDVRRDFGWWVVLDVGVLLLGMDLLMYVFHRVAHHPRLYPIVHLTHHRYDRPRPLNLFVLNPFEVIGFGGLWIGLLMVYDASYAGILAYLTLNTAFGTIGHLSVEPLPRRWMRWPVLRYLGTSTFHAEHHQDRHVNFGFYTTVWDRLFGTLDPRYESTKV